MWPTHSAMCRRVGIQGKKARAGMLEGTGLGEVLSRAGSNGAVLGRLHRFEIRSSLCDDSPRVEAAGWSVKYTRLGGSFDFAPGSCFHRWTGSRRRSAQDDSLQKGRHSARGASLMATCCRERFARDDFCGGVREGRWWRDGFAPIFALRRSRQLGLVSSMRAIFLARVQLFSCFSRAMARVGERKIS